MIDLGCGVIPDVRRAKDVLLFTIAKYPDARRGSYSSVAERRREKKGNCACAVKYSRRLWGPGLVYVNPRHQFRFYPANCLSQVLNASGLPATFPRQFTYFTVDIRDK